MNISTAKEIRYELNNIWPNLKFIWLLDKVFWKLPLGQLEKLLAKSRIPEMEFIPLFNDCDDFALQFMVEVRRKRYFARMKGILPEEQRDYPVSIGFASGSQFRGISKYHAANICICQEGIYMLDATPYENRIWKADPKNDSIFFVFI